MLFFQWDEWKLIDLRDYPFPLALPPSFLLSTRSWDAGTAAVETWHINNKGISALQCGSGCRRDTLAVFSLDVIVRSSWAAVAALFSVYFSLWVRESWLVTFGVALQLSSWTSVCPLLCPEMGLLLLTSNANTCTNVLRTWHYLNFNSKIAFNFTQDMCNLI